MYSQNVRDENGESYIPASQRPDGTWRKARRVKDGYVPQEEVPLYESKGKQLLNRTMKPADPQSVPSGHTAHKTIPGLYIQEEKEKPKNKKKNKKVEEVTQKVEQIMIQEDPKPKVTTESSKTKAKSDSKKKATTKETSCDSSQATDPAKKLKNLKKRLREVEALEDKVKSGEIASPDLDQQAKMKRKPDLLMQIRELEKQI